MATKGRGVPITLALAATVASPVTVTASREPVSAALSSTALTVIDRSTITALQLPLLKDYLTLAPSVSVSQSGPLGSQTQVRIRGAEANPTLTLIDGIGVTDPASSGEFRYETLLADGVDRIEVLRGPQSALWGSQAIGGVNNILTGSETGLYGKAQGGSLWTFRGGVGGGVAINKTTNFTGKASYITSNGYDTADVNGDGDGYENFTLHARLASKPTDNTDISIIGRYVTSNNEFDGFDYGSGVPADEPLSTRSRQLALRAQAGISLLEDRWTHQASALFTDTANINSDDDKFQNQSDGGRDTFRYQSSLSADSGDAKRRFTAAV